MSSILVACFLVSCERTLVIIFFATRAPVFIMDTESNKKCNIKMQIICVRNLCFARKQQ